MQIWKKVPVKQVLTHNSKQKLQQEFKRQAAQLEQECHQLTFEKKKIERKQNVSREEVSKRFQREIDRRKEKIRWAEYKLEQLAVLPLGSEITEGEIETLVEVQVGDDWDAVMSNGAIVVEDGIVIRMDE
ncbi:YlqD family protein [Pontibacillus litoralis]|uniref:YlqD protein n=1 Tax=Pontibacillus litoralis JSM 072002 TaxID=1385512 RepID=A0A0A5G5S7_9BACI|nr:YlqD family protein [Pontibacillus litoralis]KGX88471.1 hypothetical protein N784_07330 [Pontibacillus litoralis JSM 072002]